MQVFKVFLEVNCPECHGQKGAVSKVWQRLEERERRVDPLPSPPWLVTTVADRRRIDWFLMQGFHDIPARVQNCQSCEGAGTLRKEVLLMDALTQLEMEW